MRPKSEIWRYLECNVRLRSGRHRVSILIFLPLTCSLWAQHPFPNKADETAIKRVKTVQVSSLDRGLPEVSLEFFLKYEGEGAPIRWRVSNCDQLKGNPFTDREQDPNICVEADIDLKEDRSATIIVSVGTIKADPVGAPTLFSVTVTDRSGATRAVRRLSDLPMELHRPLPKWPRDVPLPGGAALLPLVDGTNPNA